MIVYILFSVIVISLISLIGVMFLGFKSETIKRLVILFVSFAAGTMLGDVFIHLIPEYIEEYSFTLVSSLLFLSGIIMMFIIEKILHWHHCHLEEDDLKENCDNQIHPFAIMNLVGDFFHNFLDGVVIASSYLISVPVGIATTIAVALHEIPQEISDYAVLVHGGFSRFGALLSNFLTSLSAILGAILTYFLSSRIEGLVYYLIPISGGALMYIAMSDLIPQLHKETGLKTSLLQTLFFILGVLVMLSLILMEY